MMGSTETTDLVRAEIEDVLASEERFLMGTVVCSGMGKYPHSNPTE
jgi:hypothetical protein